MSVPSPQIIVWLQETSMNPFFPFKWDIWLNDSHLLFLICHVSHYFEDNITHFIHRINKCISLGCSNGQVAPFIGLWCKMWLLLMWWITNYSGHKQTFQRISIWCWGCFYMDIHWDGLLIHLVDLRRVCLADVCLWWVIPSLRFEWLILTLGVSRMQWDHFQVVATWAYQPTAPDVCLV